MLSWLLLVSTRGRRIDRSLTRLAVQEGEEQLLFSPDESLLWLDDSESAVFLGWQSFTDTYGLGSHWAISENRRLTAFSGHVWPTDGGWNSRSSDPWARQLDRFLASERDIDAEQLSGIYSIVSIGRDRRGVVAADPYGVSLIYEGSRGDVLVLGTRASLVAAVLNASGSPSRDPLAMAWMANFGYIVGNRTSFERVTVSDASTQVVLTAGTVRRVIRSPFETDATDLAPDANPSPAIESLVSNSEAIAQLPAASRTAQLSGGKDSRLVVGLLSKSGNLDAFELQTTGSEQNPDVVVARQVAEHLNKSLSRVEGKGVEMTSDEFLNRAKRHVFQTCGMFGVWDLKGGVARTDRLVVGGLFGELYRSHFAANRDLPDDFALIRQAIWGLPFDAAEILRPEIRSQLDEELTSWFDDRVERGARPSDMLDLFYMDNRLRRWFGTAQEIGGVNPQAFPLESVAATKRALRLGHHLRRLDSIHFTIMRAVDKGLTYLPFAGDSWDPSLWEGLPESERYRQVAPVRASQDPSEARRHEVWQIALWDQLRPAFEEVLLDTTKHEIYDIVDASRLAEIVRGNRGVNRYGRAATFATLGAAIWLAREETPVKFVKSDPDAPTTNHISAPDNFDLGHTGRWRSLLRRIIRRRD